MSEDPNGSVTLSNGAIENLGLVRATLLSLRMMQKDPMTFYDAVTLAREPSYKIFQKPQQTMEEYGFINTAGTMHDSIRNIIVCAVKGEDFDMEILSTDEIFKSKK